jgi:hypothetical protein
MNPFSRLRKFFFPTPKEVAQKQLRLLLPEHQAAMWDDLIGNEFHRAEAKPGTNEQSYETLKAVEAVLVEVGREVRDEMPNTALDYDLDYGDLLNYVHKSCSYAHAARREYEQLLFGGKTDRRLAYERGEYVPEEDEADEEDDDE